MTVLRACTPAILALTCDLGPANFWLPPAEGQKAVQRKPMPR
jgi:hypothetical protein